MVKQDGGKYKERKNTTATGPFTNITFVSLVNVIILCSDSYPETIILILSWQHCVRSQHPSRFNVHRCALEACTTLMQCCSLGGTSMFMRSIAQTVWRRPTPVICFVPPLCLPGRTLSSLALAWECRPAFLSRFPALPDRSIRILLSSAAGRTDGDEN